MCGPAALTPILRALSARTGGGAGPLDRTPAIDDLLAPLDRPLDGARRRARTRLIVVHCSATRPGLDIGAAEIDGWHRARGFRGIGYHAVIRRSGDLEPGRPLEAIGAHARGQNAESVAVCLVGGLDARGDRPAPEFTDAQFAMLDRLIGALAARYPEARLVGHRDLDGVAKACPSFDVGVWAALRRGAPSDSE